MSMPIRALQADDHARWLELWEGYNRFYERGPDPVQAAHTWRRLLAPDSPVHGVVACDASGRPIGLAHYILHENTNTLTPVCYLQDLFVDPAVRAAGVGGQMLDWLVARMKENNWSHLYWNTRENNYRARGLYDKYTPHSGFLRYVLANTSPSGK